MLWTPLGILAWWKEWGALSKTCGFCGVKTSDRKRDEVFIAGDEGGLICERCVKVAVGIISRVKNNRNTEVDNGKGKDS